MIPIERKHMKSLKNNKTNIKAITRFIHAHRSWASVAIWSADIFIIPQQTFDVRLVGGTWTSWSPFAMRWYKESISSDRLFFRETKDMPKKTQLSLPYTVYKWLGVSHGIYDGVRYMVSPFKGIRTDFI